MAFLAPMFQAASLPPYDHRGSLPISGKRSSSWLLLTAKAFSWQRCEKRLLEKVHKYHPTANLICSGHGLYSLHLYRNETLVSVDVTSRQRFLIRPLPKQCSLSTFIRVR